MHNLQREKKIGWGKEGKKTGGRSVGRDEKIKLND